VEREEGGGEVIDEPGRIARQIRDFHAQELIACARHAAISRLGDPPLDVSYFEKVPIQTVIDFWEAVVRDDGETAREMLEDLNEEQVLVLIEGCRLCYKPPSRAS